MTPIQLWVSGIVNTSTPNDFEQSNVSAYGIDFEGPLPSARHNGETWQDVSVEVPEIICPISEAQLHNLT